MNSTQKTLIILNPHAASGRAGRLWSQIEPILWNELGELVVAITQRPEDVAQHLNSAREAGLNRVIAIGGDGTNHALVNELVRLNEQHPNDPPMTFGSLPIGTGHDWARMTGVPLTPEEAVKWIKGAHPIPLDVGRVKSDTSPDRHFLNIASVGISGVIAQKVNQIKTRRFWTYHLNTLKTLFSYKPPHFKIKLDGQLWYDSQAYICAIANGKIFGRGLKIAPNAQYDDGLFDVVLIENIPPIEAAFAMNTIYSGAHLKRKDVHEARAKTVEIEAEGQNIDIEMDGENIGGRSVRFDVLPRNLSMLINPQAASH